MVAMAGELGVEHRLHQRTQEQAIVGGDEVQGAAHGDDPDDLAVEQQPAELIGREAFESRPQPEVRVERHLGLHPDQVVDHVEHGTLLIERAGAGARASPGSGPLPSGRRAPPAHHDRS